MSLPIRLAARGLNALFRYELAAARCYRLGEHLLPADRASLTPLRLAHESAAGFLRDQLVIRGWTPLADPGLWNALVVLAEASGRSADRRTILQTLLGAERHGLETYEAASRLLEIPGLNSAFTLEFLPRLHEHVRRLEQLLAPADSLAV